MKVVTTRPVSRKRKVTVRENAADVQRRERRAEQACEGGRHGYEGPGWHTEEFAFCLKIKPTEACATGEDIRFHVEKSL